MNCSICKKYINPKKSGYFRAIFYTKNGNLRYMTWCNDCSENREKEIKKEYDRRLVIDQNYIENRRKYWEENAKTNKK